MTRSLLIVAVLAALSSPAQAVQDYDRPYMYCPVGTMWHGWRVLGDIRRCGTLPAQPKKGTRR